MFFKIEEQIKKMASGGKYQRRESSNDREVSNSSGEPTTTDSGKGSSTEINYANANLSLKDPILTRDQQKLKELDDEEYCDYTKFMGEAMKEKITLGRFQGTSGTEVSLATNFFRVNFLCNM